MTLDPNALVSTDEARTYLQLEATDKPPAAWLEQVIGGLSLRVIQYTGRTYINPVAEDKAATRQYVYDPGDAELPIDNMRELSLVEVSANPQTEEWEEVGDELFIAEPLDGPVYDRLRFFSPELLPAQGTGWSLLGLHASASSASSERTPWPHQVRTQLEARIVVRVTGKLGFGKDLKSVPANVKLAVLMWAQNIFKRDAAFFGEQAKVFASLAMPKDVKELLDGESATRPQVTAV